MMIPPSRRRRNGLAGRSGGQQFTGTTGMMNGRGGRPHGLRKMIGPMNASATEWVSLLSMEMDTAPGLSGSVP
jgi:hypothetical protein